MPQCHDDPMFARRVPIIVTAVGLTMAACGSSDPTTTPATDPAPPATEAAAGEFTEVSEPDVAATEAPAATEASADTGAPATEAPAATEPPATEAPPAEPEPAPVGGRAFATDVQPGAEFDGNPFPDLVVDDVGRDGRANTANILPSDRPVLLWTWAPH